MIEPGGVIPPIVTWPQRERRIGGAAVLVAVLAARETMAAEPDEVVTLAELLDAFESFAGVLLGADVAGATSFEAGHG